jgi:hypothetical protein
MVRVSSLFGQLLQLFPRPDFQRAVSRYGAEHGAKGFGCWDQFVSMLFCQLAQAHSLREICGGLESCLGKVVHLGMKQAPKKSTLAYANSHRPWQLYREVFHELLATCQQQAPDHRFRFRNKLYSLDATVIDLSLSLFDWARFTQTKGAVKLHLLLDHDGYLPTFAHITEGNVPDLAVARRLDLPAGSVVVIDRGYTDYRLFGDWTDRGVWFVTRLKRKAAYIVKAINETTRGRGVVSDLIIRLTSPDGLRDCPHDLRLVRYVDPESGAEFEFLTNNLTFGPTTVARIYKERWQVELFCKALKQNLRIKTFVGTSANALKIQIWTALIAILLLKFLQMKARLGWSLSNLVALLRWNLFTYRDLWKWIDDPFGVPPEIPQAMQLELAW